LREKKAFPSFFFPSSSHTSRLNTRFQNSPSRESRDTPSYPSQKNRQKLPFASMLLLCQHSHYVSANSKPLLYLFRVYDILYFTFLIIFLFVNIRRAVSLPSAYCQTTYSPPFRLGPFQFPSATLSARVALPPLVGYLPLLLLS